MKRIVFSPALSMVLGVALGIVLVILLVIIIIPGPEKLGNELSLNYTYEVVVNSTDGSLKTYSIWSDNVTSYRDRLIVEGYWVIETKGIRAVPVHYEETIVLKEPKEEAKVIYADSKEEEND